MNTSSVVELLGLGLLVAGLAGLVIAGSLIGPAAAVAMASVEAVVIGCLLAWLANAAAARTVDVEEPEK